MSFLVSILGNSGSSLTHTLYICCKIGHGILFRFFYHLSAAKKVCSRPWTSAFKISVYRRSRRSRVRHHKLVDLRCITLWEKKKCRQKNYVFREHRQMAYYYQWRARYANVEWATMLGTSNGGVTFEAQFKELRSKVSLSWEIGVSYPIKHHNDDWFLNFFFSILAQQRAKIIRQFAQVGAADCDWPVWLCPAARPIGGVLHAKAASTVHDV